jgi:transcription elongation factor Elf1
VWKIQDKEKQKEYHKWYDKQRYQKQKIELIAYNKARSHSLRKWLVELKKQFSCIICNESDFVCNFIIEIQNKKSWI